LITGVTYLYSDENGSVTIGGSSASCAGAKDKVTAMDQALCEAAGKIWTGTTAGCYTDATATT
jgi:hypothetical protein